jgi:hypothetical protein
VIFSAPPRTLDAVPGGLELRGSVRVWDLKRREILRTISIPNAGGTIDVRLIPDDPQQRGYTAGMLDDKLYLLNTRNGTARPVFDFSTIQKTWLAATDACDLRWPQAFRLYESGRKGGDV